MMRARPRLADETPALAAVAAHLHAQRVALYPAAIERGAISEADAAAGIRVMAAIALDWHRRLALCPPVIDADEIGWHRYLSVAPPADATATNAEKVDTLAHAAERAAILHGRMPADAKDDYADCVAALLWWQQPHDFDPAAAPGATSRLDRIVAMNMAIRAAALPKRIAA